MRPSRAALVVAALIIGQAVSSGSLGAQVGALRRRAEEETRKRAEAALRKASEDSARKKATSDSSAQGAPSGADAQSGGRFRARMETAVEPAKVELVEFDRSKLFINGAVEMTMAGVRGLHRGLDTEIRLLGEFVAQLETYRSSEEYSRCVTNLAMSPEAQQITMRIGTLPENASAERLQSTITKMNEDMQALMKKTCGADVKAEWPQHKREEKLKAIAAQAAAAAGPVSDASRGRGGPAPHDDFFDRDDQQGGMSEQEYAVWKERFTAYCAYKKLRGGKLSVTPGDGYGFGFSAVFLNPKAGTVVWTFSAEEVVLADAECYEVVLKIGKIQQIIEMPPIYIQGGK